VSADKELPTLPTDESGLPTLEGLEKYAPGSVGNQDEKSVGSVGTGVGLRREWRINASTGELRGVLWRDKNKDRKGRFYVGKRYHHEELKKYQTIYEAWRGANRTLVSVGLVVGRDAT
jgi:hypothetical protein